MAVENLMNEEQESRICSKLKTFYNNYFPTDSDSYKLRIPFLGIIISIFTFAVYRTVLRMRLVDYAIFMCGYIFVVFGVNYELYYGLKKRDRTHITPWLLLKFIEIIISVVVGFLEFTTYRIHWDNIIFEALTIGLNIAIFKTVFRKSTELVKLPSPEKMPLQDTV